VLFRSIENELKVAFGVNVKSIIGI